MVYFFTLRCFFVLLYSFTIVGSFLNRAHGEILVARYDHNSDSNVTEAKGHYKIGKAYTVYGETFTPSKQNNYIEEGYMSWYGPGFDKRLTANGEIFFKEKLTAAHRTLPIPSIIKVTNLCNSKAVILKVNDRGPFISTSKRIVDVSEAAARELGFIRDGVAKVRVELLQKETTALRSAIDVARVKRALFLAKMNRRESSSNEDANTTMASKATNSQAHSIVGNAN